MDLRSAVLAVVTPTREQINHVDSVAGSLVHSVAAEADRENLGLAVKLVGSVAKNTYVYPPDIDVFILFPPETSRNDLERIGLSIGRRIFDGEERYAEHPYVHGKIDGLEADIVPCFRVDTPEGLKSAVDRTPFHTDYVISRLRPGQHDEVRLLKQFMKGLNVYGAEAKVEGFSGYLVELLVLRYGDFEGVVGAAKDWTHGTTLSLEDVPHAQAFKTPLVFFDPVDPTRNVSSALSPAGFATFVQACREYLESPSLSFFLPEPLEPWTLSKIRSECKAKGTRLVAVMIDRPDLTEDNLYPQMKKTLQGIGSILRAGDLTVLDARAEENGDKVLFLYELTHDHLPATKLHLGPPVWTEHSDRFLAKWSGKGYGHPFILDGRWAVKIPRRLRTADEIILAGIGQAQIGSDMRPMTGLRVLKHAEVMRREFKLPITRMLDKTPSWKRSRARVHDE